MATMRDVARRAGVSSKTVSNVLNGYPYIKESTRARVLAAIDELGYQMNISARNLRSGRTGIIALAVPELTLPYFAQLCDAVIEAAGAKGWTVIVEPTGGVRERELDVLSGVRRHLVDGVIFSPLALGPDEAQYLQVDFPLVMLGERILHGPTDHVAISNAEAARTATQHLLDLGRRRIAVIGANPGEVAGAATVRLDGYLAALEAAGIKRDDDLILAPGLWWHRTAGAGAMQRLLDAGTQFDAVFGFNDTLALGALHVLLRSGRRIPEDVAVIGFDDIEETRFSMPPLTSIEPGREQIARTAVDLLAERIAGKGPTEHREIYADFTLQVRESTAGLPSATRSAKTT
ncbi:LacI family DNA-binding transcriptional regulator [Paractinoplanes rishiriensis]|uniref:LacI family transcriptional regulator n=1 Tax=Paractinoplanes rishiriensis TaxID=1050105 RepID=A0A919N2K1_9ACTN|nr:LacI family DNA-binding transcriptional regulator [Actinoplanes rishiriensis]GIF00553.1 LacI family transcriptional regulator [Actinoplanes rishiriensis]